VDRPLIRIEHQKNVDFQKWLDSTSKAVNDKRKPLLEAQDSREHQFSESTAPSWIFEHKEFKEWLSAEQSCLLWIYGTTGIGKSALSAYLSQELPTPSRSPTYLTTYFFCSHDKLLLQDPTQVLLRFLAQVVVKCREARAVVREIWSANPSIADCTAPLGELLETLLVPALDSFAQSSSSQPILFLIDGLNECEARSVQGIVRLIRRLITTQDETNAGEASKMPVVKILLTSQNSTEIDLDLTNVTKTAIYGQNMGNIDTYVIQRLERDPGIADNFKAIERDPIEFFRAKSSGVFLWVLKMLDCLRNLTPQEFESTLNCAPNDVKEIYQQILNRATEKLHDSEIIRISKILQWICTAPRDLTILELRIGVALMTDPDFTKLPPYSHVESALGRCGGFLRIATESKVTVDENKVSLDHQAFKEFITSKLAPLNFRIDESNASSKIAAVCLRYLCNIPPFEYSNELNVNTYEDEDRTRPHPHTFFAYAATWFTHLRNSRHEKGAEGLKPVEEALGMFLRPASLKNWMTGLLAYRYHFGSVFPTRVDVEKAFGEILDWLSYHAIILIPTTTQGSTNFTFQEAGGDQDDLKLNEKVLFDLGAHVAAELWVTGNPKSQSASAVMFQLTWSMNDRAKGISNADTVDVVGLSKLAPTCQSQFWCEANIGHAIYDLGYTSTDTPKKRAFYLRRAKERYIASLNLMPDNECKVAQSIWCTLCHCTLAISENEGTGIDVETLEQYRKKVSDATRTSDDSIVIDIDMAATMHSLAMVYDKRFREENSLYFLNASIKTLADIVNSHTDYGRFNNFVYSNSLVFALLRSFEIVGDAKDLQDAIRVAEWCHDNAPTAQQQGVSDYYMSHLLRFRYFHVTRDIKDMEKAMSLAKSAVKTVPWDRNHRNGLAVIRGDLYSLEGDLNVLNTAIEELENLLAMRNLIPEDVAIFAPNMKDSLVLRMQETGGYEDLEKCENFIFHSKVRPAAYFIASEAISDASIYRLAYKREQEYEYLKQAYSFMKFALSTLQAGHKDVGLVSHRLSEIALLKYDHTGCSHCLDEAVEQASNALEAIQRRSHINAAADCFLAVAEAYQSRFEQSRAIIVSQASQSKTKNPNDLVHALDNLNLAREVNDRKWRDGDFELLHGIIQLSKAIETPNLPGIENAVETLRNAVKLSEKRGWPARLRGYHQLSVGLRKQYEVTGVPATLDESTKSASLAVALMPKTMDISYYTLVAPNLSRLCLLQAQSPDGEYTDFCKAVKLLCLAIVITPLNHAAQCNYFKALEELFEEGPKKYGPGVAEIMDNVALESKFLPFIMY
jgi:hypothetical protein